MTNAERDARISRLADQAMLLRCLQILLKSYGTAVRRVENKMDKTVEQKARDVRNLDAARARIDDIASTLTDNESIPSYSEEDKF